MRKLRAIFCALLLVSIFTGSELCYAYQASDTTPLNILMRLFEVIALRNPNYNDTLELVAKLDPQHQEERLKALAERNASDAQTATLIDSLLSSPAYKLYYAQFSNVTPDIHRRVFAALPYRAIPAPADIGQIQLELFQHRSSLPALVRIISTVDVVQAIAIARKWAPPGNSPIPATCYILDGNADAFARDGAVCFDLYGILLSKRAISARYINLNEISPAEIEAVLAHEFQHVFAGPYLYPSTRKFNNWQALWEDIIIRRIVSEGVALQCNPPSGFKRAIYEDSNVIHYWLGELERIIGRIRRNEIKEDSVRAWLDRSYQESARQLLIDYLGRTYPEGDQRTLTQDHITERPNGVYVLGWWMISHIVSSPGGHDRAVQLLIEPHQLFQLYDAAVSDDQWKIAP